MSGKDGPTAGADRPDTYVAAAGRRPEWTMGVVNPPVFRASTIVYESVAAMDAAAANVDGTLFYGRKGTPTTWALREALTGLEPGAAGTMLFPSGVAALSAGILAVARPGSHVLVPDSAYEPTASFLFGMAQDFGIEAQAYDPLIGAGIDALIRPETALILLESPGSLTFEVQDVPAICRVARARGVATLLDNTWAASVFFKGIPAGCDMVMQALTKYVAGHSDAMMGSLSAGPGWFERVRRTAWALGQCVSGDEAALVLRGLRTLLVRLRQQEASALAIARHLAAHPLVACVRHPALPSCPGHASWQRDFSGSSGLFGFDLKVGTMADAGLFCDRMAHFRLGFSWGGYESLIIPARAVRRLPQPEPAPLRFRVSIGLEDPADLLADLEAALARLAQRYA
ncbi:MAG: cystathionine beta-lyase [Sphingomonadaceae bacterium]